jgi:hypothetical protein
MKMSAGDAGLIYTRVKTNRILSASDKSSLKPCQPLIRAGILKNNLQTK